MVFHTDDTIAAIATAPGESGIGIVRISGKDALRIADAIFVSKNGQCPSRCKGYTMQYGFIRRPNAATIDEVLLTVMRAPRSYTREDVIEINCHGGIVAQRAVLDLVLENDCRLAQPGEFTKRAFLNGRIDLSQAEAILDIIRAKTDSALRVGMQQLAGDISKEVIRIRKQLLRILAVLEANIDFPEEEISPADLGETAEKIDRISSELKGIIDSSSRARIFREGINAVICGKPNVGKSSLLNALLKQERSIVTPVPGTTRDTIEEIIDIRGIPVKIVDTAGIIEPRDLVEKKAIQRTQKYIKAADVAIVMFDASKKLSAEDETLIRKFTAKKAIAVLNKIDLKRKIQADRIANVFGPPVEISAKRCQNISGLEEAIVCCVYKGNVSPASSVQMSNARHIYSVRKAQELIAGVRNSLGNSLSPEFIAQDIKYALNYLDEIVGKIYSEDVLDRIFSEFCIGK